MSRPIKTFARWWKATMPSRESLENNRFIRPVAHRVLVPALWRFTRRSVPRGVALGLFVGIFFLIPGVQIAGAALFALPFRANVPVAAGMTFLSNPATTPFILAASIWIGNHAFGYTADISRFIGLIDAGASVSEWWAWLSSEAAPSLIGGLFIISALSAIIGYVLAAGIWRWWISHKWHNREEERARIAAERAECEKIAGSVAAADS